MATRHVLREVLEADVGAIRARLDDAQGWSDRAPVVGALLVKAAGTVAFCAAFVVAFVVLFGEQNAIVGVVVLLSVLTFQKVHFGYRPADAAAAMLVVFGLYAVVPPLVVHAGPVAAALLTAAALALILALGCDRVAFQNHIVLVLSFLLLYGYPVSGQAYHQRVVALLLGGAWAASILYRHHRDHDTDRRLADALRDAVRWSPDTEWRLKLTLAVPLAMLCGQLLGLDRPMWVGIAAMSVLSPSAELRPRKMVERLVGTVVGIAIFLVVITVLPVPAAVIGLTGGFLVGLTTSYRYQTVFNTLGAMSVALALYGPAGTAFERLADNALGIVVTLALVAVVDRLVPRVRRLVRSS